MDIVRSFLFRIMVTLCSTLSIKARDARLTRRNINQIILHEEDIRTSNRATHLARFRSLRQLLSLNLGALPPDGEPTDPKKNVPPALSQAASPRQRR